jgi:uncharacterized protein involved in response to NO
VNHSTSNFALFNYGFRPFFLLAGLYAVIVIAVWSTVLMTGRWPDSTVPPYLWHAHEMLFGFVGAAIAGFLLTAVPSWTGERGFSGTPLMMLTLVWIAGRLAFVFHALFSPIVIAMLDFAFFPVLALMLAPSLLRGNSRNLVFLPILVVLATSNLLFHIALEHSDASFASYGLLLGINTILVIIAIIGGRIVPAFTLNAVRGKDDTFVIKALPALDRIAVVSMVLIVIFDLLWPPSMAAGWLALLSAPIHAIRLARWKPLHTLGEPIVWILHIGYAWIVIGLALKGLFILTGNLYTSGWLHAITAGAFATMILAVMTRAALGHTGRPLIAPPLIVVAYGLITLAAIIRVSGPAFPDVYLFSIAISSLFWIAAFMLFLVVYAPILIRPRADGKPG